MPAIFVHGNPETAAVWDGVRAALGRDDTIALRLPGFGSPRPEGFGATKDEYASWLVEAIEDIGEPVDLVGHDWGGVLALRVACLRSDLLRSWASDAVRPFHPAFEWHAFAKIWQTPGEGEQWVESNLAAPIEVRASALEAFAVPHAAALDLAGCFDAEMGAAMLALYRSAAGVGTEWRDGLAAVRAPGLRIQATEDPFDDAAMSDEVASWVAARTARLEGLGHWWLLQDSARGAQALKEFWQALA